VRPNSFLKSTRMYVQKRVLEHILPRETVIFDICHKIGIRIVS
jgi:hypothetical protein